jgi:hypothetical protein
VVESSLGVPTGCVGKLWWQTAGMFGKATMAKAWVGVGKVAMAETHEAKEGASGGVRCSHWHKTSVGTLQARGNH